LMPLATVNTFQPGRDPRHLPFTPHWQLVTDD
jgi:hypothetical protein